MTSKKKGPAALERPGPGKGTGGSDAALTVRREDADVSAFYEPIDGHPGFYRHGQRVTFRVRDRRGKQRWASAQTLREAQRLKVELEAKVRRGEYDVRNTPRFDDYAREWIESYAGRTSRGISDDTRSDYRKRLEKEAIPFFGRLRLSEIEPRDVRDYAAALSRRGSAANTVRLAVAPARALFATAVEDGLIRSNPAAGLRLFVQTTTHDVDDVKALSEPELVALLDALPSEWRLFFEFLAQTGLRIGEAIEIRYRDVEHAGRWLHVRRRFYNGRVAKPKSRKTRRIRLTPAMAEALLERREAQQAVDDELVFTSERGGRVDQSNLMSRVLKPAAVRAGLGRTVDGRNGRRAESWVGFHTFRHTCATMLFRHGWNAVQVQKFLGHAEPGFTLRTYVHLLPEDLPEPAFLEAVTSPGCDTVATQPSLDRPKSVVVADDRNASSLHDSAVRPN